ncbi:hypothetical protein [Mycobacterium sp. EPa45]|uniref:hypothetical protein n=1 Tax=Mycobacterium sp. EPa45 TaxID=1545728 RepID=UPI000642188A|nr:hypothetical protein [Mycobacterium sp. EPa45]AKK29940.1 hypothetical protein AB431_28330 [Mycobacterium sp. EPa45]
MSSLQWVIAYLCAAALVAGGAMAFAAWSRKSESTNPSVTAVPAVLAGALWPLIVAGLAQWLLVHALGKALRRETVRGGQLTQLDTAA